MQADASAFPTELVVRRSSVASNVIWPGSLMFVAPARATVEVIT
jgi:hypothetical protein